MNKKGFFLSETIVVISVVAIILVGIFGLFSTVYTNYKDTELYNTSNALNATVSLKRYYESKGIDLTTQTGSNPIIDMDSITVATEAYTKIKDEFNVKNIYLIDVDEAFSKDKVKELNLSFRKYLQTIQGSGGIQLVAVLDGRIYGNLKIKGKNEYSCYYPSSLVKGAEYRNGDYIYRYKQVFDGISWNDTDEDKWGIKLVDEDTGSLPCTTINDIEIITEPVAATGNYVVSRTPMNIGSAIPNDVNVRSTAALAMADWQDIIGTTGATRPFYLKHILNSSDEIEESYVEFVVTAEMAAANEGMVAGTYTLKGGDSGAAFTENMNTIKTAFDYANHSSRCGGNQTSNILCSVDGLLVRTFLSGNVFAYGDGYYCFVNSDGSSYCVPE